MYLRIFFLEISLSLFYPVKHSFLPCKIPISFHWLYVSNICEPIFLQSCILNLSLPQFYFICIYGSYWILYSLKHYTKSNKKAVGTVQNYWTF